MTPPQHLQESERACEGCGTLLPAEARRGRPRKWCSERCRRSKYDRECIVCGGRASGRNPGKTSADGPRCAACATSVRSTAQAAYDQDRHSRRAERLRWVAEMYNAGLSQREIAARLGYGETSHPPELNEARRAGLIGYRYKAYEKAQPA